ncbi:MAG: polysaccharide deacetylase family protein [Candidatus Paceibacterota bacterium]
MKNFNNKIKVIFSSAVIVLVAGISYGAFVLNSINLSPIRRLSQMIKYWNYKNSLAYLDGASLTAAAAVFDAGLQNLKKKNSYSQSVPVLIYHGIVGKIDRFSTTENIFKDQMAALKKAGYQTIKLADFYDFISGKKDLPEKSFLLTFDDGRKDSYYGADPILQALGYSAVMFAVTRDSLLGSAKSSTYYLNKGELQEMIASDRWEIGSHGKQDSHDTDIDLGYVDIGGNEHGNFLSNLMWMPDLNRLESEYEYATRVDDELAGSKKLFENTFNVPVEAFAFPFGDYGQQSINNDNYAEQIIRKSVSANYNLAFRQVWEVDNDYSLNYKFDDPLMAKRIEAPTDWTGDELVSAIENAQAKSLPYTDTFISNNGWKKWWGNFDIGNTLKISSASSTGAFIFLDGSYPWQNYVYNVNLDWQKGSHIGVAARFKDSLNYVDCTYSDNDFAISEHVGGDTKVLFSKRSDFVMPKSNVRLGILVNNNEGQCLVNGNPVAYSFNINPALANGGVGIKIWDPATSTAKIIVREVKVLPIESGSGEAELADIGKTKLVKIARADDAIPDKSPSKPVYSPKPVAISMPPTSTAVSSSAKNNNTPAVVAPDISLYSSNGTANPYIVENFPTTGDWSKEYGELQAVDNHLRIKGNASTTVAMAILAPSKNWSDYKMSVLNNWSTGSSFSLVARYKDSKNYLACTYSNYGSRVNFYVVKNGISKRMGSSPLLPIPYHAPWENTVFRMTVNGEHAECLVGDQVILNYDISGLQKSGGIGFKTWDQQFGYADIILKRLTVEPI